MSAALLSLVVPSSVAISQVHGILASLLPPGHIRGEANTILDARMVQTLTIMAHSSAFPFVFGLLSLIWASMQIYIVGSISMNLAFEASENRSWVKLRTTALWLLLSTGALLLASLWLTGVVQSMDRSSFKSIDRWGIVITVVNIAFELFAAFLNAAMFALIYKILPAVRISWRSAIAGGIVASVLFEIAKRGIAIFLLRPNHGIYGHFADLIVIVLWIYYSTIILILGCEAAAVYERNETIGKPSGDGMWAK
jgi:membrane protein